MATQIVTVGRSSITNDHDAEQWMLRIMQSAEPLARLRKQLGDVPDLDRLLAGAQNGCVAHRTSALIVLARLCGIAPSIVARILFVSLRTVRRQFQTYRECGVWTPGKSDREAREWMLRILQNAEPLGQLRKRLGDIPGLHLLATSAQNGSLANRNSALIVLARLRGIPVSTVASFLHIAQFTVQQRFDRYRKRGIAHLFHARARRAKIRDDESLISTVHTLLHSPPSDFGIDRCTWRMEDIAAFIRADGDVLSRDSLRSLVKAAKIADPRPERWLVAVMQEAVSLSEIRTTVGDAEGLELLVDKATSGSGRDRKRALSVLGRMRGMSCTGVAQAIYSNRESVRKHWRRYKQKGSKLLFEHYEIPRPAELDHDKIRRVLFATLHSPPSVFGINRTSWKINDLKICLAKQGLSVSRELIGVIIRAAGYRWLKARAVLTSDDPAYREKLDNIHAILSNLRDDERFFSIDEFGPFSIKIHGGRKLVAPNGRPKVPQRQKPKGRLILTAALELSRNQITHFYSERKNSQEIIKLLKLLVTQYKTSRTLYFSWDAASWHESKSLRQVVTTLNSVTYRRKHKTPKVVFAPLPSNAQFLNVIESVFSGMARAIIHNSNYRSVEEASAAIDRYILERNEHFRLHPKKAGKKIWGKERVITEFNEANNCKDPLYSR